MIVLIKPAAKLRVLILIELSAPTLRPNVLITPLLEILPVPSVFVLIVLALILAVVTPPVGENPPAKFKVCAQIVVVDTVNDCKLLVKTEDVNTFAKVSNPPSLIIVYQLVPFAKKAIAP